MIGIMTQRNSIKTGYPVLEAILTYLPTCDRYIVNDGGSTDGTLEVLMRLSESYPQIEVTKIPDYKSERWDCVSEQINTLIREYAQDGEWVLLGNADELLHEKDVVSFGEVHEETKALALRFPRIEIPANWKPNVDYPTPYLPARTALNIDGLYMNWPPYGGDEFLDEKIGWRRYPPHCEVTDIIAWHMYSSFPENTYWKRKNDAEFIATADVHRKKMFDDEVEGKFPVYRETEITADIPALAKLHAFKSRYEVQEQLFDPSWVSEITQISY